MANLTGAASVRQISNKLSTVQVELYAGQKIYQGAMVCRRISDGYAVVAGTANTGRVQGIAVSTTATCVTSGDTNVNLLVGEFALNVHASRPPVLSDIGKTVYASDDNTVSTLPTDGPAAGILTGFEATTGLAIVAISPEQVSDSGWAYKEIPLPAILAAGTPMAAFADNAASNPGITLVDSEGVGIRWNNNGTQVAVWTGFSMPGDIDTNEDAILEVLASKVGATGGDAVTFVVTAFNQAVGALHDADADFGGSTSAMTGDATSKTVQKVTLTLAAANLAAAGEKVSLSIKPASLGTDDVTVFSLNLKYRKKAA